MRKGCLMYEEMRKYLTIYEEVVSHICLCNQTLLNFLTYEAKIYFLFYQCTLYRVTQREGERGVMGEYR
jgi:hypothetical protein